MKTKSKSLEIWDVAVEKVNKIRKPKKSATKDMVHRRLRPEPEIIENILEDLEEKIKHYFNLFRLEKEKRTNADKNNYYLQEEIVKAYETLEKNKIHTMKLEEKLNNIKDNQSSLIDTVRRIDLLYIQLDTLVQSFAGVCTQTATDVIDGDANLQKKKKTIQMLLDYIYPCRTLDPRINTLYGLLYYQTIGLINSGFSCPPAPPIPPVVPSEINGWLPPSPALFQQDHLNESENFPGHKGFFSDNDYNKSSSITSSNKDMSGYPFGSSINLYDGENNLEQTELLGFDIKIGLVELKWNRENPKIVCVVRYDHETAYASIQNSKRITKPQIPSKIIDTNNFHFEINSTIHLNSLPPKQKGMVPKFKIDIHDVKGKVLVGTAKCSFINDKTLKPNAAWDIYSRMNKNKPTVIGKIYVSVFAYPSNAKLPAEIFQQLKSKYSQCDLDSINSIDQLGSSQMDGTTSSIYSNININNAKFPVKSIMKPKAADNLNVDDSSSKLFPYKNSYQKIVSFKDSQINEVKALSPAPPKTSNANSSLNKQKVKVTFKSHALKKNSETTNGKTADMISQKLTPNKSSFNLLNKWKNDINKEPPLSTKQSFNGKINNINETTKKVDILKKPLNSLETESKENKSSNVNMLINKIMNNINMKNQPLSVPKENIKLPAFVKNEKSLEKNSNIKNSAEEEKSNNGKVNIEPLLITKNDTHSKSVAFKTDTEKMNSNGGKSNNKLINDINANINNAKLQNTLTTKNGLATEVNSNNKINEEQSKSVLKDLETDTKLKIYNEKNTPITKNMVKEKTLISKTMTMAKNINKENISSTSKSIETLNGKKEANSDMKATSKSASKSEHKSNAENSQKLEASNRMENDKTEIKKKASLNKIPDKIESDKIESDKIESAETDIKKPIPWKKATPIIKTKEPIKESEDVDNINKPKINKLNSVKEIEIKKPVSLIKHKTTLTPLKMADSKKGDVNVDQLSKINKSNQDSLIKNTNTNQNSKTSKSEEVKSLQKPKQELTKNKVTTPLEFEQRKHPPPPTSTKLEHIDSDSANLKKILEETKKKSIILNKNKMKKIVFKNHEQKRMIKKFIPKYKQEVE